MREGEFEAGSIPNIVSFAFEKITPPSPLYITRDDFLIISAMSGFGAETVTIAARLLLPYPPLPGQPGPSGKPFKSPILGGPAYISTLVQQLSIALSFTFTQISLQLAEGFLLSVAAVRSQGGTRGECFAEGHIRRGGSVSGTPMLPLFGDYLDVFRPAGWPFGRVSSPVEGPGAINFQTVANPLPGADWVFVVPSNSRMQILSFQAQLATSATAGTRIPRVRIRSGATNPVYLAASQQGIPPSTTVQVSAGQGQVASVVDTTTINLPLPGLTFLDGNGLNGVNTLDVTTLALAAGDQWSSIRIGVQQWVEGI